MSGGTKTKVDGRTQKEIFAMEADRTFCVGLTGRFDLLDGAA